MSTLKGISKYILVNERINSQRCVAQNINTTKTIIEHNQAYNPDDLYIYSPKRLNLIQFNLFFIIKNGKQQHNVKSRVVIIKLFSKPIYATIGNI